MVDVRAQQGITLDAVLLEGHLKHDELSIPILEFVLVGSPGERAVHEELCSLGPVL